MKAALFVTLGVVTVIFAVIWILGIVSWSSEKKRPGMLDTAIGFVTNFFDTLGIGSFATTSAFFKFWRLVRDEHIPGTLNVGHTAPSVAQAFIYIAVVQVDVTTLILMIGGSPRSSCGRGTMEMSGPVVATRGAAALVRAASRTSKFQNGPPTSATLVTPLASHTRNVWGSRA